MFEVNGKAGKQMEILAPAGSYEAVEAAVRNGANAVYLGQQKFNARQNAENFDLETLKRAVDFCHLRNVKVYQTLNTIVFDDEMEALQETIQAACGIGIDAFIIQDFGVLRLVQKTAPKMRIHGSTQMSVHTPEGARLLKEMGVRRVVLSREMSLEQIREVIEQVDIEVEVFAHGALCMSVSGQCYMSAAIGGRSGNKGSCAGTCRLPFSATGEKGYDLSLKDLCLAPHYEDLKNIGVTSLKIEGRMKRPEYVAASVRAYAGLEEGILPQLDQLKAVFSRSGFTDGYFTGRVDGTMFGVREKEDVVSATPEVLHELRKSYEKETAAFPISMELTLRSGETSKLKLSDFDGHSVEVKGEIPQIAMKKPLTAESAKESLAKLGGTCYTLGRFEAEIEEGLILPKSQLNLLRREAVEALDLLRTEQEVPAFTFARLPERPLRQEKKLALRARMERFEQIPFEQMERLEYLYLPTEEVLRNLKQVLPWKEKIILEPNRVLFGTEREERERLQKLKEQGFDKMAVSNPAHIQMGKKLGFILFGTQFLNLSNSLAAEQYRDLGVGDMILSQEMTLPKMNRIQPGDGVPVGAVIYGWMPLMIVRNCPVRRHFACADCRGEKSLTDRLGNRFPVLCHNRRYSEVLNCHPMVLSDRLQEFNRMDFGVLYFTKESRRECEEVIADYLRERKPEGDFTRGLYYRGIR